MSALAMIDTPVDRPIDTPAEALKQRVHTSIERLVDAAAPATILEALAAASEPELFEVIVRAAPIATDAEAEQLARERMAAAAFKHRMAAEANGFLTAIQAARVARYKSDQAIYKAARERRVLMVEDNGRQLFPAFQFDEAIRKPLIEVFRMTESVSGWEFLHFIFGRPEGLAGARPVDLLRGSKSDIERVARFAAALED